MHTWRVVVDQLLTEVPEQILLPIDESYYLSRVLRLNVGAHFEITDGQGHIAQAIYDGQNGSRVYAKIHSVSEVDPSVYKDIRLYVAQPDRKALEEICYHASSVGVSQVVIFIGDQSRSAQPVKVHRLEALARESLRFSKNPWLPNIFFFGGKFYEGLMEAIDLPKIFCCDEQEKSHHIREYLKEPCSSVGVFIGPEGGWSERERQYFRQDARVHFVSMGPWIQKVSKAALNSSYLLQTFI